MTREQAIDFGKRSARVGFDQQSVEDHRDNVRDTLTDEKASEWEVDAFRAFDAELATLQVPK